MTQALLACPILVQSARASGAGPDAALAALVETLCGRMLSSGKRIEWVVASIGEAARDLGAASAGAIPTWEAAAKTVARFADHARPPSGSAERAQSKAYSPDERLLVDIYAAGHLSYRKQNYVAGLAQDLQVARRILPDLKHLASDTRKRAKGEWSPTWSEIWTHFVAEYLKDHDQKLADQGYPLALLLSRVDKTSLPRKPAAPRATLVSTPVLPPMTAEERDKAKAQVQQLMATIGADRPTETSK